MTRPGRRFRIRFPFIPGAIRLLVQVFVKEIQIMAAIDTLNSAVARLQASVDKLSTVPPSQDPAIEAAAAAVNTEADKVDAFVAANAPSTPVS